MPTDPALDDQAAGFSAAEALIRHTKSPTNAYEVTVERLSAAIKMGLYRTGEQLPPERDMAGLMGVSRTTLREAIRVLVAQGFLRVQRGRMGGTFVTEPLIPPNVLELKHKLLQSGVTLSDILDHRLVVEMGVVELAAQRATQQQIQALQGLIAQMHQGSDRFSEYRRLDTEFHILIARSTQSPRLTSMVVGIHAEFSDLLAMIPHSSAACCDSTHQHQQILAAIQAGQAALARALMQTHVTGTSSLLNGLLG
jgi:GntR family transcriptional regulator, transcriptional repressor for pyruvate dehydrogenase complex